MRIGIDLVYIPEFKEKFEHTDVKKVFLEIELEQSKKIESLAGIFAAKEAFFKAIGKKIDWQEVWIEKRPSGQPILHSLISKPAVVSISQSGEYATAVVCLTD